MKRESKMKRVPNHKFIPAPAYIDSNFKQSETGKTKIALELWMDWKVDSDAIEWDSDTIRDFARHFYELGLKTQKGEKTMGLIDKIRAEVEKKTYMEQGFRDEDSEYGYRTCARDILSFLDTLEAKEVDEDTISKDLEYAALLYYPKMSRISEPHGFIPADNKSHYLGDANEDNRKAFIVGAQWQKEQDQPTIELAEDHAYFAGSENTREKLIDKACEWWEEELSYPSMTQEEIKWYKSKVNKFRKAMEE